MIGDDDLWFNICIHGRPSKKLFEKIVLKKINSLEKQIEKMKCCCTCKNNLGLISFVDHVSTMMKIISDIQKIDGSWKNE